MSDAHQAVVVDDARQAYAAGLNVLPVASDGTKRPAVAEWGRFKATRPTRAEMRPWHWETQHGYGVVAGPVSGHVESWDFDNLATFETFCESAKALGFGDVLTRLLDGYSDATPRDGRRILARYPATVEWRDVTLARRLGANGKPETLIELPTFAIVAPSNGRTHPSGKPYRRLAGDFSTIANYSTEERDALIQLARSFDEMPAREVHSESATAAKGTRPGDRFAVATAWPAILDPHGWRAVYSRGEVTYWRRPDKSIGCSATTNLGGSDLLYVFSSSTPFDPERSYTKFAAYAVLAHGGDFSRAARALATQEGYGEQSDALAVARAQLKTNHLPTQSADTPASSTPEDRPTEYGAAIRFTRLHGSCVRFDYRRHRWLLWHGHRWMPDADAAVMRLALDFARTWQREGVDLPDRDKREAVVKFAIRLERCDAINNMLRLAKALKPIADTGEQWDTHLYLLGTPSGVVDLRTATLRAGDPADALTLQTAAPYDPDAPCPRWERFIAEIFDGHLELMTFVQRAIGYSLTGDTSEQVLFLLYGTGANGKGTLTNTLKRALGDYAWNMPFATIEMKDRTAIPNDLAALVNRRFVIASETNDGSRLNEARVKALTGCDPITARFLHGEFFTFEPLAKFWLSVNHKPIVRDDSYGFWRRLRLIPFTQRFDVNSALADELQGEAAGILAWCVRGALDWQRDGLQAPSIVTEATKEYEQDSDALADFLAEACELEPSAEVGAKDLHEHYVRWAAQHGLGERERLSATGFGRKVAERFRHKKERGRRVYLGLSRLAVAGLDQ